MKEIMLPPNYTFADFEIADKTVVGLTAIRMENSRLVNNLTLDISPKNKSLVEGLKAFIEFAGMDPIYITSNLDKTMGVFNSCCQSVGLDLIPNSVHQVPINSVIATH